MEMEEKYIHTEEIRREDSGIQQSTSTTLENPHLLRSLQESWSVGDSCLRVLDCGSLKCCFLSDRNVCSNDCLGRHEDETCSDSEFCVQADGLSCCNGKCIK